VIHPLQSYYIVFSRNSELIPESMTNSDVWTKEEEELEKHANGMATNGLRESEKSRTSLDRPEEESQLQNGRKEGPLEQPQNESARVSTEKKEDVPPNGGYGWVCIFGVVVINAYVTRRFTYSPCYRAVYYLRERSANTVNIGIHGVSTRPMLFS
jgi:hypothetical protein